MSDISLDNKFDFAWIAGVNYVVTDKVQVSLRYIHALTPILKDIEETDVQANVLSKGGQIKNRSFQLSLSY